MIDATVLYNAENLKKTMDAAYLVFKKRPTLDNATTWSTATRAYNDFCIKTITDLLSKEDSDKKAEILANIDKYKECKNCGKELVYVVGTDNIVTSIDFAEDFPGWCYECLVDYCTSHNCEGCTVSTRPLTCSFAEIKKLHEQSK